MAEVQHVFIIGSKGLGNYGGYETFVDHLTAMHQENATIKYHVACKMNGQGYMDESKLDGAQVIGKSRFRYNNADCFKVRVPEKMGSAQAIYYDIEAFKMCLTYIKRYNIKHAIIYVLACRIGPAFGWLVNRAHSLDCRVFINPDGHEWKRAKWPLPIRKYWKESEKLMVKHADAIICDSKVIEKYIKREYSQYHPKTVYISYGADLNPSRLGDKDPAFVKWLTTNDLTIGEYYLAVGRFLPENNFEVMIREFMKSDTDKDFAIITTTDEKYSHLLNQKLNFANDKRIKFVGTVYDPELLKKIRENAFAYLHGHSVGGTNPSLLESLGSTRLNLLFNVSFNKEAAEDAALYWNKSEGNLSGLIDQIENMESEKREEFGEKARKRIEEKYSWEYIADRYDKLFHADNLSM